MIAVARATDAERTETCQYCGGPMNDGTDVYIYTVNNTLAVYSHLRCFQEYWTKQIVEGGLDPGSGGGQRPSWTDLIRARDSHRWIAWTDEKAAYRVEIKSVTYDTPGIWAAAYRLPSGKDHYSYEEKHFTNPVRSVNHAIRDAIEWWEVCDIVKQR